MNYKKIKTFILYVMSFLYIKIGIDHFTDPGWFIQIVPPYLSYKLELVYISGFFEILFGLLILFKRTRFYASWGLILLLAAVFPANIYLAQTNGAAMNISSLTAWLRLPFQSLLIIIAYWHSKE